LYASVTLASIKSMEKNGRGGRRKVSFQKRNGVAGEGGFHKSVENGITAQRGTRTRQRLARENGQMFRLAEGAKPVWGGEKKTQYNGNRGVNRGGKES